MKDLDIKWEYAPDWADRLMGFKGFMYWCSVVNFSETEFYKISHEKRKFSTDTFTISDFKLIEMRPEQPELDIKWEDAPTDTAVWIVLDRENESSGWYLDADEDGVYRKFNGDAGWDVDDESGIIKVYRRSDQPKKADEWVPVVGKECLGRKFNSESYEECKVVHIDGNNVLALFNTHYTKGLSPKDPHWCENVSPLKTAEEKKREYNYGEILKMLNLIHTFDFCPVEAASVLAHEGFPAPKGGE
mgnify:CR=1 FL=1